MTLSELDFDRLGELEPRRAEDVGRAIAETLTRDPTSDFTNRLVVATQYLQVDHSEVREALSTALFHAARVLRDRSLASETKVLWAAIRMAAVFARKPEGLAPLLEFMPDVDMDQTWQVSLQAIANVSQRGPQPPGPELSKLADQVEYICNRCCHAYLIAAAPDMAALAVDAVLAARALSLQGIGTWKREIRKLPRLFEQLQRDLAELTRDWPSEAKDRVVRRPPPPRNPPAVQEWMLLPMHRQLATFDYDGGAQLVEWIVAELEARDVEVTEVKATLDRLMAESRRQRDSADQDLEEAWEGHKQLMEETPGGGLRRDRKTLTMPLPRRYPRLTIGQEFVRESDGHRFRVTDVGARTFLAIDLTECEKNHPGDASWLSGPPYAVSEVCFDEADFGVLEGVPGIEWTEQGHGKALGRLLASVKTFAKHWKDQDGANGMVMDAVVDDAERYWGTL